MRPASKFPSPRNPEWQWTCSVRCHDLDYQIDGTRSATVQDLHCKNLKCSGNLEVQGDTKVEEVVFGFHDGGISNFFGKLETQVFIEGNHSFEYADKSLEAVHHISFDNYGIYDGDALMVTRVLSDSALERLDQLIGIATDDADRKGDYDQLLRTKGFLRS